MRFTSEEKQKMGECVDKIKAYIALLQPKIRDTIQVDFGEYKTYYFDRERECKIYIDGEDIWGRIGGLRISFEPQKNSSVSSDVYNWLSYTVQLIENWPYIKQEILNEIENRECVLNKINNFEV